MKKYFGYLILLLSLISIGGLAMFFFDSEPDIKVVEPDYLAPGAPQVPAESAVSAAPAMILPVSSPNENKINAELETGDPRVANLFKAINSDAYKDTPENKEAKPVLSPFAK